MIDNLLKGASGQAVQNMNLMFGLTKGGIKSEIHRILVPDIYVKKISANV